MKILQDLDELISPKFWTCSVIWVITDLCSEMVLVPWCDWVSPKLSRCFTISSPCFSAFQGTRSNIPSGLPSVADAPEKI